jgi:hypothetical protein
MSEINRGMPEGLPPKATVINFEVAKATRLEAKNRHAQWIQERTQPPIRNRIAEASPGTAPALPEVVCAEFV